MLTTHAIIYILNFRYLFVYKCYIETIKKESIPKALIITFTEMFTFISIYNSQTITDLY